MTYKELVGQSIKQAARETKDPGPSLVATVLSKVAEQKKRGCKKQS